MASARMRVLIVEDDDDDLRSSLAKCLDMLGYGVVQAGDGAVALDILESDRSVDAIILDLRMPRMDGTEFLSNVRRESRWAGVAVVVTTGTPSEATSLGVSAVLEKPVELAVLICTIQRVAVRPR